MKRFLKAYTTFTRTERMGLVGLCTLLAALIAIRATMPLWVKPGVDTVKPQQLLVARQADISAQASLKRQSGTINALHDTETISPSPGRGRGKASFDPNTADSLTLSRAGLHPRLISNLLKWRAKGRRFYKKEDIKPLYGLTAAEYQKLEPLIVIQSIDLNTADSLALLKLYGIGPKLAHKIIVSRNTRGPFARMEELREMYPFSDSVFAILKDQLAPLPP